MEEYFSTQGAQVRDHYITIFDFLSGTESDRWNTLCQEFLDRDRENMMVFLRSVNQLSVSYTS